MNIAYTMGTGRGDTDLLLQNFARDLIDRGTKTCGTVQTNTACPGSEVDAGLCDMDVQVLPDGPVLRISQSLGKEARGCRLDPAMLEHAVALCEVELAQGPEILIVNKFGKHEADGRGFRSLIADALQRDIPVLVGLNTLSLPAFEQFTQGFAVRLQPDMTHLNQWFANIGALEPAQP